MPLFARNKRTVRLTEAGALFRTEARETLGRAALAVERVQKTARGEIGKLTIAFVSSAALAVVPSIVIAFRKKYPGVTLDLINLQTTSQIQRLLEKSIDIGFLRLPLAHAELKITVIHREGFVVVLPRGHRLAREKRLRIAQLRDEPFVAYGRQWAPGFFDSVVQLCTREGSVRTSSRRLERCIPQPHWLPLERGSPFCRNRWCWRNRPKWR